MSEYKAKHFPDNAWDAMKYPTIFAAGWSLVYAYYDVTHLTQCKTIRHAIGRTLYYAIPVPALVAMYIAIKHTAKDYRGRDDAFNFYLATAVVVPLARRWASFPTIAMGGLFAAGLEKNFIGYMFREMKWDDTPYVGSKRIATHYYRRK
ncbi:NADH:ubiquinone oxidoreductase subunit V3 isoform X1 [Megalopta genalis]|uniref:NADH:ubiquinone oxidoreductase subunit V3 isoform X1 n=1 Tax=Megalopta genalis TaxID=115081 RepID=UPI003FD0B1D2